MIHPRNTEWNRKLNLLNTEVSTLLLKSGIIYFQVKSTDESIQLYHCEESVFMRQFDVGSGEVESLVMNEAEISELMKKSRRYP